MEATRLIGLLTRKVRIAAKEEMRFVSELRQRAR
jgi:hypothetical protein